jgi:adenylate cyclase
MGDQVIGLFVPRFAGRDHAKVAVQTALDILRATGHQSPSGSWIPVGIGVHTGLAYVGTVGTRGGVSEIAVLGNTANLAARLSAKAAAGEVLISETSVARAGILQDASETRTIEMKGMSEPVPVRVLRA